MGDGRLRQIGQRIAAMNRVGLFRMEFINHWWGGLDAPTHCSQNGFTLAGAELEFEFPNRRIEPGAEIIVVGE